MVLRKRIRVINKENNLSTYYIENGNLKFSETPYKPLEEYETKLITCETIEEILNEYKKQPSKKIKELIKKIGVKHDIIRFN